MTSHGITFPSLDQGLDKGLLLTDDVARSQAAVARWVEDALQVFFSHLETQEIWQGQDKPSLIDGARYALLNDGGQTAAKRLRPWFLLLTATAMNRPIEKFYHLALAIELIHGYSLVHDDLPAMDNDAMRRGKPTLHRAFLHDMAAKDNEAFAILVGDLLQSLAFELLAMDGALGATEKNSLLLQLARAAGAGGMVSGQWRDIVGAKTNDDARLLKAQKTGALIEIALTAPLLTIGDEGMMGHHDAANLWRGMAGNIGRLYQALDDMMDEVASSSVMGKETGKDRAAGKSTTIALQGLAAARQEISGWLAEVETSVQSIKNTSPAANPMKHFMAMDLLVAWLKTMVKNIDK